MIGVVLRGGLGNQLFQFAAARMLSTRWETNVALDLSFYSNNARRRFLLDRFKVSYETFETTSSIGRIVSEKSHPFDVRVLNAPSDCILDGCFESYCYFKDVEDVLREELVVADTETIRLANKLLTNAMAEGTPLVSVHVRRGDFLTVFPHMVLTAEQYREAMSFFLSCTFLVFSDDLDWCRNHLSGDRVYFMDGKDPVTDMMAMAACDHHIYAHSTFGWWGQWMNSNPGKKTLTLDTYFFPPDTPIQSGPGEWIVIEGNRSN